MNSEIYRANISDVLYGSYIRYDRLYEMTKHAFYGRSDSNDVNIYIDIYSILRSIYTKGSNIQVDDSCVIASCMINLAIHLRAYFESRHSVNSRIYLIYGGARPREAFVNYSRYNEKNIIMEDSNVVMKNLIMDNLNIMSILCPYLHDIFTIVDYENEFSVIASTIIDRDKVTPGGINKIPNIIYSKDPLAYQLVAFKQITFLYRPKKKGNMDASWVVTKSALYNAYRYGELSLNTKSDIILNPSMFSIYQAISGVKSRSMNSIKNGSITMKILKDSIERNVFSNGYNSMSILYNEPNPFEVLFNDTKIDGFDILNRFGAIDLPYQTMLFAMSTSAKDIDYGLINLYNPQEVRNINDKYFQKYPLDLNRV